MRRVGAVYGGEVEEGEWEGKGVGMSGDWFWKEE